MVLTVSNSMPRFLLIVFFISSKVFIQWLFVAGGHSSCQVPELEEPHPETCNEQQFLCIPNNQSTKVGKAREWEIDIIQVRQAPLYGIDGVFETLDNWNDGTSGGLDVYEPGFQVKFCLATNRFTSAYCDVSG